MVPAVAAAVDLNPLTGDCSELPDHGRCDGLLPDAFDCGCRPLGFGLRLIADRFTAGDAVLERRVVQIGDTAFNRITEPFEPQTLRQRT